MIYIASHPLGFTIKVVTYQSPSSLLSSVTGTSRTSVLTTVTPFTVDDLSDIDISET